MTNAQVANARPSAGNTLREVLLATDLSARGDRALARAVAIAKAREAHLTVLHVLEEFEESHLSYAGKPTASWRAPPDALETAKLRMRQGLEADLVQAQVIDQATVVIKDGEPADAIEQIAAAHPIDLIVTGIAREGLFASRPVILGRTVERLLRRVPVPILIVRNRPRASYRHILVMTDFSEPSANALQVALTFFPGETLHLLHAFEVPYSGVMPELHRQVESFRQTHAIELSHFLSSMVLPDESRQRFVPLIEPGRPANLVRDYVRDRGADLVVLGTHGRGVIAEAFIGSTAKSILSSLPCDALIVRAPLRRITREPPYSRSQ
jgi:nucleotide-binding universal stress UspA family protein